MCFMLYLFGCRYASFLWLPSWYELVLLNAPSMIPALVGKKASVACLPFLALCYNCLKLSIPWFQVMWKCSQTIPKLLPYMPCLFLKTDDAPALSPEQCRVPIALLLAAVCGRRCLCHLICSEEIIMIPGQHILPTPYNHLEMEQNSPWFSVCAYLLMSNYPFLLKGKIIGN